MEDTKGRLNIVEERDIAERAVISAKYILTSIEIL